MEIAPVLPHVPPIRAAVAPIRTHVALVLPDVTRILPCRGRITSAQILPALAAVLPNAAAIAACVTPVRAQLALVAAHFVTISGGVAGLLSTGCGGDAKCQSQQRGDECPVSHVFPRTGYGSWLRRRQDWDVKPVRQYGRSMLRPFVFA